MADVSDAEPFIAPEGDIALGIVDDAVDRDDSGTSSAAATIANFTGRRTACMSRSPARAGIPAAISGSARAHVLASVIGRRTGFLEAWPRLAEPSYPGRRLRPSRATPDQHP